jgi:hypothetical protein
VDTDVSEEHFASILGDEDTGGGGGGLAGVCQSFRTHPQAHNASQPRRLSSTFSIP